MKIVVLNGSPKGKISVTMQYLLYIEQLYPQHQLEFINISLKLPQLERSEEAFHKVINSVRTADAVIWASPVYYWLVPSNYKRFIELILEREVQAAFRDKYTAFITTSIHFFDHTAHNYLRGICEDLEMRFLGSYSAEMSDLLKPVERKRLQLFAAELMDSIERKVEPAPVFAPISTSGFEYQPGEVVAPVRRGTGKALLLTDLEEGQGNLKGMIDRFSASFAGEIETVNLHDLDIKGSCLGCLHCAWDNHCVYEGKDEYVDFFNEKIAGADILIWGGAIRDRYLSATWKRVFDRSFFRGHVPTLTGKQVGYIISGPLTQLPNLRQILEAYIELQGANLAGIVTDEAGEAGRIDRQLDQLGERLLAYDASGYARPASFLGVGGALLFRDHIYGKLRFPFRADYLAYKRSGAFNFPQKRYKRRLQTAIMLLLARLPRFRRDIFRRLNEESIKPLQRVLASGK